MYQRGKEAHQGKPDLHSTCYYRPNVPVYPAGVGRVQDVQGSLSQVHRGGVPHADFYDG